MGSNDQSEECRQYAEQIVRHLSEEDGAGGTIGPEGLTLGIPNWAERTKDQRFSERVKTHGYPLGFANSQYRVRNGLVQALHDRADALSEVEQSAFAEVHEAVAWALDAERVLGSFNQGERGGFPVEAVNTVADQFIAWLDHRGFVVVPKASQPVEGAPHEVIEQNLSKSASKAAALASRCSEVTEVNEETDSDEPEDGVQCPRCEGAGCEQCGDSGWLSPDEVAVLCEDCGGRGCKECGYVPCPLCQHSPAPGCAACSMTGWIHEEAVEYALEEAGYIKCPFCEGSGCSDCEELGWLSEEEVTERLGEHRMMCFACGGEGQVDPGYPVSWACTTCLGTGEMSVADLSEYSDQLAGADLSGIDLTDMDFSDDDLSDTDLSGTNLSEANLSGANLANANLDGANLSGADLSGCNIEDASSLRAACMKDVVGFTEEQRRARAAKGAWFRSPRELASPGVDWSGLRYGLHGADLHDLDLSGANLTGSNLKGADLRGTNLTQARLAGASLSEAKLNGAILRDVDLTGIDMEKADLSGMDLAGMKLTGANLTGAILMGTNLPNAVLSGAGFSGTDLTGANLAGADLTDARLYGTKLEAALSLQGTNLLNANGLTDKRRLACLAKGAQHV